MSSGLKRPHAQAVAEAGRLIGMLAGCFSRLEIAGSVRRGKSEVGDVEIVLTPRIVDEPGDGLFAEPQLVNLLWRRVEELIAARQAFRHVYGTNATGGPMHRWGEKYKGIDLGGHMYELFVADVNNWGGTLAIRTGSADFSKGLVTGLLRGGRRNKDGYVWACRPCEEHAGEKCPKCDGTRLVPVEMIPAPTEEEYFKLCGVAWREPKERN